MLSRRSRVLALAALGALVAVLIYWMRARQHEAFINSALAKQDLVAPLQADPNVLKDSELTSWPWPGAKPETEGAGITHWFARQSDGTTLDLLRFDFKANPRLKFGLYSQDEDDDKPGDNVVRFWPLGVGQAVRHLNEREKKSGGGAIVAAWNGPFFGYYRSATNFHSETAFHLAPIVLNGKVLYNHSNYRWTFGVKYENGRPHFKTFHLPGRALLEREFDYASGTIQCLIKDGVPLRLQPFPQPGQPFAKQPFPSTPQEVGHIRFFDHAKFSRASLGWSKDSQQLYMLLVREPSSDGEGASIRALIHGDPQSGGWNVADLQRFWKSLAAQGLVFNAINSDAGDVGQLAFRKLDGKYTLVSPRGDSPFERRDFDGNFASAPQGGALMYFWVKEDSKGKQ